MNGGVERSAESTITGCSSRLEILQDRLATVVKRIGASADFNLGSLPEPGNNKVSPTNTPSQPGQIPMLRFRIDQLEAVLERLESQSDRLLSGL